MIRTLCLFFISILLTSSVCCEEYEPIKKQYSFANDPIDIIIVTHPKDKKTLDDCINGLKENCKNYRRIIVVSSKNLTDQAEWYDEANYPFSKEDIGMKIARGSHKKYKQFFEHDHRSPGWYFQQLLKLYSPFVIPGITSNVLVVDSDTIFMNPVEFLNEQNGGLLCFGTKRVMSAYFKHAERLIPGYKRINTDIYSVCHHMLFQRVILEDLFAVVENYHHVPFWEAFCLCVDRHKNLGASEFEIYFNFALTHSDQIELRKLKWRNSGHPGKKNRYKDAGYDYVSFHTYMRG